MGTVCGAKIRRNIEDGKRAVFKLWTTTDDLIRKNDDGECGCGISVLQGNTLLGQYHRKFMLNKFHDKHYERFINKFCADVKYREKFILSDDE